MKHRQNTSEMWVKLSNNIVASLMFVSVGDKERRRLVCY